MSTTCGCVRAWKKQSIILCFRLAFLHLTPSFVLAFVPGVLLHEYAKGERKDGEKKDRRAEFGKVFILKNILSS